MAAGNALGQAAPAASPEPSSTRLAYVMVFVADMKRSVAFYRDQLGLKLRFASPGWSEFETGDTILALHPAGRENKAGTSEIGFTVQNLNAFYEARKAAGVSFSGPPMPQSYGSPLTEMRDPDGALISVGGR
jgi:lactoylglutathione lyase